VREELIRRSLTYIGWMMRRRLLYIWVGLLLAGGWLHAGEMRKPVGRLVLTLSSIVAPGGGMGQTTGEGRLTLLDNTAHAFSVSGLNLQGRVGSSIDLEVRGEVYHLQRLEDFAGTYRRFIGAVDPERPTNTLMIENEQGVLIAVTVTAAIAQTDVRILPSESGVTVKLRE
jgi:hypothetical protein